MRESFAPRVDQVANRPQTEEKPEPDQLMKVREAAEYVKVSRDRIDGALASRELAYVILGPGTRRIWLSDLKKWLASKTVKALQKPYLRAAAAPANHREP